MTNVWRASDLMLKRLALKPGTVERARKLRRDATEAERRMLRGLKGAFPAAKFRFQVPFGPYYADFASHGAKLVIELDGGQHAEATAYDEVRTRFLNGEGYQVLRFWNNEVMQNLEGVLTVVSQSLPSPLVGEGGAQRRMRGRAASAAQKTPAPEQETNALQTQRAPHPLPSPTRGEGVQVKIQDFGVR
jgi:very-short-patch-repair endonuclease